MTALLSVRVLGHVAIGSTLGLGRAHGVREVGAECRAGEAFGRDGLLLGVDPVPQGVLGAHHRRRTPNARGRSCCRWVVESPPSMYMSSRSV